MLLVKNNRMVGEEGGFPLPPPPPKFKKLRRVKERFVAMQ